VRTFSTNWQPNVTLEQLVQRVLTAARPGAIILLHDGGGDRSATLAALPTIVTGLCLGLTLTVLPT
jgi:hypothetical protein